MWGKWKSPHVGSGSAGFGKVRRASGVLRQRPSHSSQLIELQRFLLGRVDYMATPWVCSSCRTRIPAVVKGVRSVSQTASLREGIGAVQDRYNYTQRNEAGSGNGNVRGRYSGREIRAPTLRPEAVLHQLYDDAGREKRAERTTDRKPHSHPPRQGRQQFSQREGDPRQNTLPPALIRQTDAFIDAVHAKDLALAWDILTRLSPQVEKIFFPQRTNWLRKARVQPCLAQLHQLCTAEYLDTLENDALSTHTLPTPYAIVHLIDRLGFGKPVFFRPRLWDLASGINDLRLTHPTLDLQRGIEELMKIWRLCFMNALGKEWRIKRTSLPDDFTDWSFLPALTPLASARGIESFDNLLLSVVISKGSRMEHHAESQAMDYSSAALVTLDLLRTTQCKGDESGRMFSELEEYRPWVALMETFLRAALPLEVPFELTMKLMKDGEEQRERGWKLLRRVGVKLGVIEALRESVGRGVAMATTTTATSSGEPATLTAQPTTPTPQSSTSQPATQEVPQGETDNPTPSLDYNFSTPVTDPQVGAFSISTIGRLNAALAKNDLNSAEGLRMKIATFAGSDGRSHTALPIEVYEHLMKVLFALKAGQSAVEVWRKFTADGYVPTTKTYTVLMQGAQHAHDVTTMERFWGAMRGSGLQPDEHAWSTRVNALLRAKLVDKGLAALSEMGREWYNAAKEAELQSLGITTKSNKKAAPHPEPSLSELLSKYPGPVNSVPRPNLITMNAAIAALANTRDQYIPKVLQWGRTFHIKPDLITYNALLNICMRHARAEEALAILHRMQSDGIQADSTTWTVLLTALFHGGFLDNLTHQEQGEKLMSFIQSLSPEDGGEGGGRGLDEKGFALIIDRLLKVHGNTDVAAQVLQYMVSTAGLRPTAQIYTILMTSYFFPGEGKAPDFRAIETLWNQIKEPGPDNRSANLDSIFFDRMVEGYAFYHAELGSSRPALDFLGMMSERGMKPGFGALEAVARMSVSRGEIGILRRLVGEVMKRGVGKKVFEAQRSFWEFVVGTGVLRDQEIGEVRRILEGRGEGRHWMDR